MRKIMVFVGAEGIMTDTVDKVLADEQSKINRLNKIKEVANTKIADVEQETLNLTYKLEEIIRELNLEIRKVNVLALEKKEKLKLEIKKADKAIERLSK